MIKYIKNYLIKRKYKLHDLRLNGANIKIYGDGNISSGAGSYIGDYSQIQSMSPWSVKIGKKVRISHFVAIYNKTTIADQDYANEKILKTGGDIVIGDYSWIGAQSFISYGVEIGENTVVGVNSLVNKNLPPHAICVGTPCKVIKFKSYLKEEEKIKLAKKYSGVLSDKLKKKYSL